MPNVPVGQIDELISITETFPADNPIALNPRVPNLPSDSNVPDFRLIPVTEIDQPVLADIGSIGHNINVTSNPVVRPINEIPVTEVGSGLINLVGSDLATNLLDQSDVCTDCPLPVPDPLPIVPVPVPDSDCESVINSNTIDTNNPPAPYPAIISENPKPLPLPLPNFEIKNIVPEALDSCGDPIPQPIPEPPPSLPSKTIKPCSASTSFQLVVPAATNSVCTLCDRYGGTWALTGDGSGVFTGPTIGDFNDNCSGLPTTDFWQANCPSVLSTPDDSETLNFISVVMTNSSLGIAVVYEASIVGWDGISERTLNLVSDNYPYTQSAAGAGNHLCNWPSTVTITGSAS